MVTNQTHSTNNEPRPFTNDELDCRTTISYDTWKTDRLTHAASSSPRRNRVMDQHLQSACKDTAKNTWPFHTQLSCSFYQAKQQQQQNTQCQPDNRHQARGNLLMSIQVRPFQPAPLECWRGWARFWLGCLLSTQGLPPAPLSHPVPATPAKGLEGKVVSFF